MSKNKYNNRNNIFKQRGYIQKKHKWVVYYNSGGPSCVLYNEDGSKFMQVNFYNKGHILRRRKGRLFSRIYYEGKRNVKF